MKVVITGGGGFLGSMLAQHLIIKRALSDGNRNQEEIDSLVLFDSNRPQYLSAENDIKVEWVQGDISDRDTVASLIDRDDIGIFHLASIVSAGGERDFDLAIRVNLEGGLNVLEAARRRKANVRIVFASSFAVFGGELTDPVTDHTKHLPQTTYGVTKAVGELMIDEYSRKGYLDGRTARLPNIIIRPGKPNAAASSFLSGLFREPLQDKPCYLPVSRNLVMPLLGYRNCVDSLIRLFELDSTELGPNRALNLPNHSYSVAEMIKILEDVAQDMGRSLGPIVERPDPEVDKIVSTWAPVMNAERALRLGLPQDTGLRQVILDYIEDFPGQQ